MRVVSTVALSAVNTATVTSTVVLDANQIVNCTFQTIMGDATAAGAVKVQGSNDNPTTERQNFTPTNWSDIPSATSTIASGVGPLIVISNISCQWFRVVYTRASGGSSTIKVVMNAEGV